MLFVLKLNQIACKKKSKINKAAKTYTNNTDAVLVFSFVLES